MFQAWLEQQKIHTEADTSFDTPEIRIPKTSSAASAQPSTT